MQIACELTSAVERRGGLNAAKGAAPVPPGVAARGCQSAVGCHSGSSSALRARRTGTTPEKLMPSVLCGRGETPRPTGDAK
jgi:hypothetical protein